MLPFKRLQFLTPHTLQFRRLQTSLSPSEIATLLSKPTWSVKTLLPNANDATSTQEEITPQQLSHLLRLSALPQPTSPTEESEMLSTLTSQIHFVKEVQAVDTTGVEPLRAIRDETAQGVREATVGLEQMKGVLDKEERLGRNGRVRRRKDGDAGKREREVEGWDPLELAEEKRGRFFVVRREKQEMEGEKEGSGKGTEMGMKADG